MAWILLQRRPFGSWQSLHPNQPGRRQQRGAHWSSPACQRSESGHTVLRNPTKHQNHFFCLLLTLSKVKILIFQTLDLLLRKYDIEPDNVCDLHLVFNYIPSTVPENSRMEIFWPHSCMDISRKCQVCLNERCHILLECRHRFLIIYRNIYRKSAKILIHVELVPVFL